MTPEGMLSLALLVSAGLLIESVNRLASVPLGFRTNHVFTVSIELPKWNYSKGGQRDRLYREVLEQASILPGVESAAFASSLPLNDTRWRGSVLTVSGRPEPVPTSAVRDVGQASITPNYFRVMGVPLERGRLFDNRDRDVSEVVAIVNEALVRKYFPHESPIGKQIKVGESGTEQPWLTIVGVAGEEKDKNFFREMSWEDIPLVFRPVSQDPPFTGSLVVRTAKNEIALATAIQKQISRLDSSMPIGEMQTMDERLSRVLAYPRLRAVVLGAFAGLALLLAGVGVYGVLSQLTAQRTQELGVRMALGAQKHDVLALVIRQAMILIGAGLVAGVMAALCLTRLLNSLLYGVRATDPWTLIAGSLLLFVVACSAIYLPARGAAKVDPMVALRYE